MSEFTINIRCPRAVIEFMETRYGQQPIRFPRKDRFNSMISFALQKPPKDYTGEVSFGEETLAVFLPSMEDKNVRCWNYLTQTAQQEISARMKAFLKAEFHNFMDIARSKEISFNGHASVYLFMEQNGINPESFDMLLKERQRYLQRIRWHRYNKKIVSDKTGVCPQQ
ncbi:MAG: hypothetical protein V1775_00250 [Bacteroidota bacterium]